MKKNVLMKSKRMAAFALSLSMVLSEGSLVGAAELNANDAEPAVVTEADTEATEVDVQETETAVADQTTETASTEEASEQAASEVTVPETEAVADETVPAADETAPVVDEAAPEAEAETEETTEEETESADLEEDTEELGAYNGTPSKVIGLEGTNGYDQNMPVGSGSVVGYNYVNSDDSVVKPGDLTKTKDPSTGLYNVDGKFYVNGEHAYTRNGDYTTFSGEVIAVFPANQPLDPTTGLLVANGVYYTPDYGLIQEGDSNVTKSMVAVKGNEVVPVGVAANHAAADSLAGGVDADGNASVDYYVVNGKFYKNIYYRSVYDGTNYQDYWYAYNEITFEKVRPEMQWNSLSTENIVVNGETKKLERGYQVKVNDVLETSADTLAVSATEGAMAIRTSESATLNTLVGAGESAKIQIRGVYYVENKTKDAENRDVTSYTVVATGEWSEAYNFTRAELKDVPQIGGLTATLDGTQVKLTWNPVKEAGSTYLYCIDSKIPLTNLTSENFEKFFENNWKDEDEKKALLGDVDYYDNIDTRQWYVKGSSKTMPYSRAYTYHYYALETFGGASNEYKNNTFVSNIAVVTTTQDANVPQVTGFKAEKQDNGTYQLVWNPVDANVVVYVYEKQNLPEFYNEGGYYFDEDYGYQEHGLLQAKGKDADGNTVRLWDKLTSGQKALINKVQVIQAEGLDGDEGVSTDNLNLKPGVTYYFTAFTYDTINSRTERAAIANVDGINFTQYNDFSPASTVVSVKNDLGKPDISTKASKDSIKLTLSGAGSAAGYQIYRLNSKNKYKKIATITDDVYTDSDLKANTKYSYKVRAYYYNKDTKKTVYSDYAFKSVSTSEVTDIAVNVSMKSTSQAKVTWSKVGKAEKYEIYRTNSANSDPKVISKKYNKPSEFVAALSTDKYELVKTVKKAKTTSFTDKKLKAGESYTYVVAAYYKDGKTTGYIANSDTITFAVHTPENVQTENKGTSAKITWDADKFASKFEVRYKLYDKYGQETSRKYTVKTTKKNSYTIKGLESGGYAAVSVRAYGKNKTYSGWSYVSNTTSLKVAKDITAKNITETLTNGKKSNAVKISWKKVSGAKFYRVYRSTKTAVYNKDEKKYVNQGRLIAKESNTNETDVDNAYYDEVYYDEYLGEGGSIVGTSAVDRAQLLDGVTYYYSVVAYGEKGTKIASYITTTAQYEYATSKPASVVFNKDLKISSIKNSKKGQVAIKYNKVSDAKQYVIYRADKKNGEFKKIGTSKKTSYTDKKAKKGKTYYYKVVATGTNKAKANMEVTSSVKKIKVKK